MIFQVSPEELRLTMRILHLFQAPKEVGGVFPPYHLVAALGVGFWSNSQLLRGFGGGEPWYTKSHNGGTKVSGSQYLHFDHVGMFSFNFPRDKFWEFLPTLDTIRHKHQKNETMVDDGFIHSGQSWPMDKPLQNSMLPRVFHVEDCVDSRHFCQEDKLVYEHAVMQSTDDGEATWATTLRLAVWELRNPIGDTGPTMRIFLFYPWENAAIIGVLITALFWMATRFGRLGIVLPGFNEAYDWNWEEPLNPTNLKNTSLNTRRPEYWLVCMEPFLTGLSL